MVLVFLTERTCQNRFKTFRSGNFTLRHDQRSGLPTKVNDEQIQDIFANYR